MTGASERRDAIGEAIAALNARLVDVAANDVFTIRETGTLSAFLGVPSYCTEGTGPDLRLLGEVCALVARHTDNQRRASPRPQRSSAGLEIGAGSAKLIVKLWDEALCGRTIVDLKLKLPRYGQSPASAADYVRCVGAIIEAFTSRSAWVVPPGNFDFAEPRRLLDGCPGFSDFAYVYGTQGPRDILKRAGAALSPKIHVLTGDEEGLLMFEAIVPDARKSTPGTMAIEIGSGSTEIILVGMDGRRYPITVAIKAHNGAELSDLCRAIADRDLSGGMEARLESKPDAAEAFVKALELVEARTGIEARGFFMNPNRDSAAFRESIRRSEGAGHRAFETSAALTYGNSNKGARYAEKAKILGEMAQAFKFMYIHEGISGGLKEGMAKFIRAALVSAQG